MMELEKMVKKYVITTAQKGVSPNRKFMENLELYCDKNNAELIILPTNGKYATSRRNADGDEEEVLHKYFNKFNVISNNYKLNDNLEIKHFPVKAQQIDPITGWGRFVQYDTSGIFASPKQRLKCFANANSEPKILMSTGAITKPNYKDNNWGTKALLDHVYGALIVEVKDDKEFHYRQLRANSRGAFIDLAKRYENGKVKKERAEALVLGDIHSYELNKDVMDVTYKMIKELNPKHIMIHDLFNGTSVSHHEKDNILIRAKHAANNQNDLSDELRYCGEILDGLKKNSNAKIVVVKSNHDDFLNRYLQDGRFAKDPINVKLASELLVDYLNDKDIIEEGIKKTYGKIHGVKFLKIDESYKILGYQLGSHGDKGGNGSRGSIKQSEAANGKSIDAHTHSPELLRYAVKVGCSCNLDQEYAKGPSSWLHTHGALYSHGQPQLLNIINGKYKCQ